MPDAQVVEWIRNKYVAIISDLDERGKRRWAAAEARSLGWGGIAAVAQATGMSDRTIRNGIRELEDPDALPPDRQRKPGALAPLAGTRTTRPDQSVGSTHRTCLAWRPDVAIEVDLQKHSCPGGRIEISGLPRQQYESRNTAKVAGLQPAVQSEDGGGKKAPGSECSV